MKSYSKKKGNFLFTEVPEFKLGENEISFLANPKKSRDGKLKRLTKCYQETGK